MIQQAHFIEHFVFQYKRILRSIAFRQIGHSLIRSPQSWHVPCPHRKIIFFSRSKHTGHIVCKKQTSNWRIVWRNTHTQKKQYSIPDENAVKCEETSIKKPPKNIQPWSQSKTHLNHRILEYQSTLPTFSIFLTIFLKNQSYSCTAEGGPWFMFHL